MAILQKDSLATKEIPTEPCYMAGRAKHLGSIWLCAWCDGLFEGPMWAECLQIHFIFCLISHFLPTTASGANLPISKNAQPLPKQTHWGSRLECLFVSIYKYSFLASQGPSTSRKTNLFTWSQAVLLLWKDHKLDAQKTTRPQVYRCQIHNLALLMPMAFGFIFSPENARREHISMLVPVVCLPLCIASSRFLKKVPIYFLLEVHHPKLLRTQTGHL